MLCSPGAYSRACGHALGQTSAPLAVTGNPAQPFSLVVEANFSCPEACCPQQLWTILGWRRMTSGVHSRSEAGCSFCLQAICKDCLPPDRKEVTRRTLQSFGKVKCGQHANEHSYAELQGAERQRAGGARLFAMCRKAGRGQLAGEEAFAEMQSVGRQTADSKRRERACKRGVWQRDEQRSAIDGRSSAETQRVLGRLCVGRQSTDRVQWEQTRERSWLRRDCSWDRHYPGDVGYLERDSAPGACTRRALPNGGH